jgi:hypothetical protein
LVFTRFYVQVRRLVEEDLEGVSGPVIYADIPYLAGMTYSFVLMLLRVYLPFFFS